MVKITSYLSDGSAQEVDVEQKVASPLARLAGLTLLLPGLALLVLSGAAAIDAPLVASNWTSVAIGLLLCYLGGALVLTGEFPPGAARFLSGLLSIGALTGSGVMIKDYWIHGSDAPEPISLEIIGGTIAFGILFGWYAVTPLIKRWSGGHQQA